MRLAAGFGGGQAIGMAQRSTLTGSPAVLDGRQLRRTTHPEEFDSRFTVTVYCVTLRGDRVLRGRACSSVNGGASAATRATY